MATIIGGNGTGTLDSSLFLLNRNDTTGAGTAGYNEQVYINVSNGNLVIGHQDEYLPSETNDFLTLRTYNSRAQFANYMGDGWMLSEFVRLQNITANSATLINGDGSQFDFTFDPTTGKYVSGGRKANGTYTSNDGVGAYDTMTYNATNHTYVLVQSDQTVLTFDNQGKLIQSQDTNGNTLSYTYDPTAKLSSVGDNDGHQLNFVYQNGNISEITDETGAVFAQYSYSNGQLVSVTDRAGETTTYTYYSNGYLKSITLPGTTGEPARTLQFTYATREDGTLTLSSFTDAQGNVTTFNYNFTADLNGNETGGTTTVTDTNGQVTTYTYDANGQITNVKDPQGLNTVYRYTSTENLASITSADGSAIITSDAAYYRNLRQTYGIVEASGQGKLVSELTTSDIATLTALYTTTFTYDANGNLTSRTDGNGNETTYTYTSFNKVATSTSADGNALVTSNAPFYMAKRQELGYIDPTTGQGMTVAELTAANKQAILALYTTTYTYDAHQNITKIQAPGGDLTTFAYNSFGNVIQKTVYLDSSNLTDPSQQEVTQYFYDAYGNNIKTIDAQGNTTYATFDHFGNRTTQTDGNGSVTTFTYNAENELTSVTDPLGNATVNFYDAVGNKIAVTDAAGHTITYVYSADNLLLSTINPAADPSQAAALTRTTTYTYDVMGNRTSTTDANGNTSTYTYDAMNRLLTVKTPSVSTANGSAVSYTTTYAYDGVGNRITSIDNNGNQTQTVYNSDNLLQQVTDANGHITQYAYDADLNQVSIVVGAELAPTARQILKFDYDEKDRMTSETDALGNVTRYGYDGANNRISATDANGNTTNYTYDRNNRLLVITGPAVTSPTTGQPVRYTTQYQYDADGNKVAVTDQNGHTTRTTFDKDDRVAMVQDPNGIQTVYTYDSRGNRTSVQVGVTAHVNSSGAVVIDSTLGAQVETYTYDEFNQVIAATDGVGNALISSDSTLYVQMRKELGVVDSSGQGKTVAELTAGDIQLLTSQFTERYTYDRMGNYTSTTDHLGRTTTFTYDALNRQVATTDVLGNRITSAYDGDGNVVARTDALGRKTTYAYDSMNRLIGTTDPLGVSTQRTYDSFGNLLSVTQAAGTAAARTSRFVYDLDNRMVARTDAQGNTTAYAYDAVGNRLQVTDAKGQTTRYVYDALNRNIAIIDPLGLETQVVYDGAGNRISLIDAKGGVTKLTYDAGNREIQMQDAQGRLTTFTYDALGDQISQTTGASTPQQETTSFLYDAERHLRQVTDATGHVSTNDFDADYNRTKTIDANGNVTSYQFDALNRQIQVTNATGGVTRYTYDAVGNSLTLTDPNGHVTSYAYDARNQLISETDAAGVQTTYQYDAAGNQVSITHAANTANAATDTFTYNLDNKLISQTDALGHTQTHQYDADGNLIASTDALGNTTGYTYDADNRVTAITDPLGNVTRYAYDANGNRVQVTNARGFTSTSYYNADNQVVLSVDKDGYATSFTYDPNGNLVSQTLYATALTLPLNPSVQPAPAASANDQTTLLAYDSLNRVISRTDGEGYVTQFIYDAVGNQIQTRQALDKAGTQFEVTHTYFDGVNREIASVTAQGYLTTYAYDAAGNRLSQTQYDQPVTATSGSTPPQPASGDTGRTTLFAYDADNRLVQQTDALGAVTTYTYDAQGNRTSMTEAAGTAAARTTTYTYDAANRCIETANALGIVTYLNLDADGNVLARDEAYGTSQQRVYTFTYDANNRVVSQTDPLGVVTYTTYDAADNIVSSTIASGTSAARTTAYSYDGDNRQVSSTDASGVVTTYGYDAAGNKVLLTQAAGQSGARTNSFTYNRANRLVSATDADGTVTQYQYDGAGNKITTFQAVGTPLQRQTTYAYDLDNRLIQVVDPMGAVTQYQYDAQGNQTRITDANGGVQVNTFDALGHALTSLSAGGVLTTNTYDLRGNLISATQSFANGSGARTTTYAYDLLNRQTEVTDGNSFSTTIGYDDFGNQTSITHGQYRVSSSDPSYSASKAAAALPQTNTFTYDADNRMLSMTDALGNVSSYQYDLVGNRLASTDANGHTTQYTYDLLNRLTQTTTPDGGITRYSYDNLGNKIAQDQLQSGTATSGVWAHTSYQYDANGNLTSQTDPLGIVTRSSYDAMGNLVSQTSAAGTSDARTVQMEYDLDNRKIADIDALGNRTTYAFDALGNRIAVTDALGHTAHYYYNGSNQLAEVVDPQGFINTFSYDAAGNQIQSVVYMTPVSGAIDAHTPPTPVSSSLDRVTTSTYDQANNLLTRTAPDGSLTEYVYDGAGNKVSETQFANTSAPRTLTYRYDLDDRLVSFTDVDGSVTTFTYDKANNRTSETITSTTDPNPTRTTLFAYDANNREATETFDPSGLDIVQTFTYDHLGNILSSIDGNGQTTTYAYDLDNRAVTQTDPLGNTTTIAYDRIGNEISKTDARGNTTNYVYDANNRMLQEIDPSVQVYTAGAGFSTVRPTTTHVYDAVGNEVQTTDANGNVTTSYFDGDGRLTAQINADNALTTYTYDAAGDKLTQTLYMTLLPASAHDPSTVPQAPAGDSQQITYSYDRMGRLTQTTYPAAAITSLVNTSSSNPSSVTVTRQVTERNVYDAFGNLVESVDRNGNGTFNYYDSKGNRIATVDPTGALTEWTYDEQGNIIEQRVYAQLLDTSTVSAASLPAPPSGNVYVTDIQYDAASRKISETDPQISVFDPATQTSSLVRPTTTYTYDKAGNILTQTLGAGTAQAVTEYFYYDAGNRKVAAVTSGNVLATFGYDANGNLVSQKRYINPIPASVDLAQLNGSTDFASLVTASAGQDETSDFTYDALNRQTSASDQLVSGALTKHFGYDGLANRTYTQDEDGYVTQASYDGMGHLLESISPDGSGTRYEYDAAGNQILAYTGIVTGGPPVAATNVAATLGNQLTVSWNTSGTTQQPVQTWVVYDTASHQSLSGYANRTTTQVSSGGALQAALTAAGTGGTVYFRVVTEDGAGNETWTAEQSLTIPPRFTSVSVSQPDASTLVVTADFDPGVANPALAYGANGQLTQSVAFVRQSDGSYTATLTGVSNPGALSFALKWQDGTGNQYSSAVSSFAPSSDEVGITTAVSQTQIVNGANTAYTISLNTQIPSSYASGLVVLQAQWLAVGSSNGFSETAVTGTDSGSGTETYSAILGDTVNLAAGTYQIVLTGLRADGTSVELDNFDYTVGPSATPATHTTISWVAPANDTDQLVVIDGQNASAIQDNGRIVASDPSTAASAAYSAFYGQSVADSHSVQVSSTAHTETMPDPNDPNGPPQTITTGYDVAVQATLTAGEAANVNGGLHLAWRSAGSGTSFSNDVVLTSSGTNTYSTTLSNLAAGQYDIEVYYTDAQGHQVIVEWQRIDAATVNATDGGKSLTVLAEENGGTLTTNAQGVISVTPGIYTGALDVGALSKSLALSLGSTGNAGGSLQTDGRSTGYFTQTEYNALGYKIASNSGDGLWRQFAVDGNGNAVETDLLGDRSNPNYNPANAITTYTAYDGRNRKTADFGAAVSIAGSSTLTRPVTRYGYDVLNNLTEQTDPLGNTTQYVYNALGTQTEQIDPYGATTQHLVDQFGNVTAQVTQLGHTTLNFYNLQNQLVKTQDAVGNVTTYTYDAFGRKLTETDALGNRTTYTYDQRDRLTSQTNALGKTEIFAYDGRNDRISTIYPLGQRTDQVYDGLGRVIDTEVYLNGQPTHNQTAYDAYGNVISQTDTMGRTVTHVYGAFGRLLEDIDQDGNVIAYSYDVYGHRTNDSDPNAVTDPTASSDPSGGKDIQRTYNAAGQVTRIVDLATGVSSTYTYDLDGHLLSEAVTTPGGIANRNYTYQYDALGQMTRWADSVTGDNLNSQYDAEGNLVHAYTDSGYDPLGQNTSANPNYRYVDHVYTYDADRRVVQEVQRTTDASGNTSDSIINGYTYDAAGNRLTWNNAGVIVTYRYDAIGEVLEGDYYTGSDFNQQEWTYDAMGNVLSYTTLKNGSQQSSTVSTYNDANRTVTSNQNGQVTTNTYDLSLRITQTVLQNKGKTYYYDYTYYGDGREKSVRAYGDASGNSSTTYDADKVTKRVDLGQGDGQTRPEYKTFIADNEGQIVYEFHDDGKSASMETDQYLYANSNPVGQNTVGTDGKLTVQLDSGSYAPVQSLSDSNPGNNLSYTVGAGDTLQSIAEQMYGNASLWFVIADANGLSASTALTPGTLLLIPNTIHSGTITADNHKVYSETDLVGSTLPNLKSPPPPHHGGCASILAIIIVVVIAVVAIYAVAVLGPLLASTLGSALGVATGAGATGLATTLVTAAGYALAGAIVGAVASIVQQGAFIALGYQKSFSWKDVAASAVAGALSGAAQGVGAAAKFAATAGKLTETTATYMKVAESALTVAGDASKELIENGKITSWVGLAADAVAGYAKGAQSIEEGASAPGSLSSAAFQRTAAAAASSAGEVAHVASYVTPWAQLAESEIRGQPITPESWANAVGSTLSQAAVDKFGAAANKIDPKSFVGELRDTALQFGATTLVAGALSAYSSQEAEDYFDNSVGQEVGHFIGNVITTPYSKLFPSTSSSPKPSSTGAGSSAYATVQQSGTTDSTASSTASAPTAMQAPVTTTDTADAVVDDSNGNPVAPTPTADDQQAQQSSVTAQPEATQVVAASGSSISTILGTSNSVAIEAFMRANNLTTSTIFADQTYNLPTAADYAASSGQLGQATLDADNARLNAQLGIIDISATPLPDFSSTINYSPDVATFQNASAPLNPYAIATPSNGVTPSLLNAISSVQGLDLPGFTSGSSNPLKMLGSSNINGTGLSNLEGSEFANAAYNITGTLDPVNGGTVNVTVGDDKYQVVQAPGGPPQYLKYQGWWSGWQPVAANTVTDAIGVPSGYQLLTVQTLPSGFSGASFLNPGTGSLVVADRGTVGSWGDIKSDYELATGNVADQAAQALNFFQASVQSANQVLSTLNGTQLNSVVTAGHSLGGYLAQLTGAIAGVTALAYNGPGIEKSLADINAVLPADQRITSTNNFAGQLYNTVATHDVVSGSILTNDQAGTVLGVPVSQGNVKDTAAGGVIGGILGGPIGAGVGGYLGYSYSQHALGDLQTGMMQQQHVTKLPTEPLTALFGH